MDKSLGTNSHLTRAKQSVRREFIYTCSAPPPPYNVGQVYMLFLQSFNIVWGERGGGEGKATQFETENSAFVKLMQLHKCPKEFCPPLSDFYVSWKNAQLRCFLALNAFRTQECEHLSLERHFLELLPGFSVFFSWFWTRRERC